jgi:hypothetical protein
MRASQMTLASSCSASDRPRATRTLKASGRFFPSWKPGDRQDGPDHFQAILKTGAILPEPPIANPDGWRTVSGEPYCPYVRKLGGVSLFDFGEFDVKNYEEKCPSSSWETFVPYRAKWGSSIWIEIDREQAAPQFISGPDLVTKRRVDEAFGHALMPYIEATHIGPLPRKAFARAFLVGKGDVEPHPVSLSALESTSL